jgi:hypothetical protein
MSTELKTNESEKKWYQQPLGVGVLLWLFFPVGLYFMWKEKVWTSKTRIIITSVISLFIIAGFAGKKDNTSIQSENVSSQLNESLSTEETGDCLVGYDWVYPSMSKPTGAWKFSNDGTFNYSTTMFGGMSNWGNWKIISPGKIQISYTRSSEGIIPGDEVLTLSDCKSLTVGSTTYMKY